MGVIAMMLMFHIQSWKLCYIAKYHQLLQSIALDLRSILFSGIIDRTVIDVSQLGSPELAGISLPAISCTFACHKFKHVCALRSAY
jgi:hypothetical protein